MLLQQTTLARCCPVSSRSGRRVFAGPLSRLLQGMAMQLNGHFSGTMPMQQMPFGSMAGHSVGASQLFAAPVDGSMHAVDPHGAGAMLQGVRCQRLATGSCK